MNAITVQQAESNFGEVFRRVIENIEPTIVTDEKGESVVMLSLDEYNAWLETLYLLSTPANAEHLHQSIAEDKAGYATEKELVDS